MKAYIPLTPEQISIIGWFAVSSSVTLYVTPITVFRDIISKKDVQKYSPVVYVVTVIQCFMWTFYALITPGILESMASSSTGLVLHCIFCCLFFTYSKGEIRKNFAHDVEIGLAIIVSAVVATLFLAPRMILLKRLDPGKSLETNFLGCLCVFFNVMMNASPLSVIRLIIRTKSAHFLPIWITIATVFASLLWGLYAIGVGDPYILIPCVCGVALTSIQIFLFVLYGDKPPEPRKQTNATPQVAPHEQVDAQSSHGMHEKDSSPHHHHHEVMKAKAGAEVVLKPALKGYAKPVFIMVDSDAHVDQPECHHDHDHDHELDHDFV